MFFHIYNTYIRRILAGVIAFMLVIPPSGVCAQSIALPAAGEKVALSQAFQPSILSAITVDAQNPLQLQFFVTPAEGAVTGEHKDEYLLLVKDFMTALTVPEDRLWVNLSPYEKDRVIDDGFGLTEMGRDLLGQDYILKQVTASLLYPEEGLGKVFWDEIYSRAQEKFGTTDIPVDTFNKVWIMPDVAEVYQQGTSAMVLKSRLKVMLETDYLAATSQVTALPEATADPARLSAQQTGFDAQELGKEVLREVIIPVLEKEVNEGKNFARLRQIYNALILAAWYKKSMRDTLLGKSYADQGKFKGVEQADPAENQRIYDRYVAAFRKGVFNYIKEEVDRYSGEVIPRKYLSGGFLQGEEFSEKTLVIRTDRSRADFAENKDQDRPHDKVTAGLVAVARDIDESLASTPSRLKVLHEEYVKKFYSKPNELFTLDEKKRMATIEKESQRLAAEYFEQVVLAGEEQKDIIMKEVVNPVITGAWSTAQTLLLSGTYTDRSSQYLLALAKLARRDAPVPYYEVLTLLGLNANLKGVLAEKISKLNSVEDLRAFYEKMFVELFSKDNFFKREGVDFLDQLQKRREKDAEWNREFKNTSAKNELINKMIGLARGQFRQAQAYVQNAVKGTAVVMTRVKAYQSLREKIYRSGVVEYDPFEYRMKNKRLSFIDIYDMLGGRIIVKDGMKDLEQRMVAFEAKSIMYDQWKEAIDEEKSSLRAQIRAEKFQVRKQPLEEKLKDVLDREMNLKDDQGRYIILRKDNRYLTQLKAKGGAHFRGTNYVVALGVGNATMEIQFTNFVSIFDDIDHDYIYKAKIKDAKRISVEKDVLTAIWLFHIVDGLNYLYQDKKVGSKKVMQFLRDASQSAPPDHGEDLARKVSSTGGIDVRHVEEALAVQGEGADLFGGMSGFSGGEIYGISPVILSVTQVQGFPFLNDPPPQGMFSRN